MTHSLYIIGGPGTGKSTLLADILGGMEFGEVEALHAKRNKKALVTLRGQRLYSHERAVGTYLGINRPEFPGADALDNTSSPVGADWLETGSLPPFIVGEGLALTTRGFLAALQDNTRLMVFHLICSDEERERRFAARGSQQNPNWVKQSVTRARNAGEFLRERGGRVVDIYTSDPDPDVTQMFVELAREWLGLADD